MFSILQQLFRVRNLGPSGRMTVYVSGRQRAGEEVQYPCTRAEVDCMLESTQDALISCLPRPLVRGAQRLVQMPLVASGSSSNAGQVSVASTPQQSKSVGGTKTLHDFWVSSAQPAPTTPRFALQFDRDSASYVLLRGALVMRHKSSMHWLDIIVTTLRDEYGLPVTVKTFALDDRDLSEAHETLAAAGRLARDEAHVPFSPSLLLSQVDYASLRGQQRAGRSLQREQNQQLYTTRVFRKRWQILDGTLFDAGFYASYVGLYSRTSDVHTMHHKFLALFR